MGLLELLGISSPPKRPDEQDRKPIAIVRTKPEQDPLRISQDLKYRELLDRVGRHCRHRARLFSVAADAMEEKTLRDALCEGEDGHDGDEESGEVSDPGDSDPPNG